jgi:purine-binding chemotaxis protein CheW
MPSAATEISGMDTADASKALSMQQPASGNIEGHASHTRRAELEALDQRAGKYLTFMLASEEFAIRVLKVREIMGIQDITAVPRTPDYVKGVINLRGKVIPVVDLRLKFCMPARDYTKRTCIIVVQVQAGSVPLLTGIVVDEVSEVLNLAASDVEDTPDFGDGSDATTSYLLGMAKAKGKVKILLDIDRVLAGPEIHGLDTFSQM